MSRHLASPTRQVLNVEALPLGTILPWHKHMSVPEQSLPSGWLECNGQAVNDPESPFNGVTLPDLNGEGRFLRGGMASGIMQLDALQGHGHRAYYSRSSNTGGGSHERMVQPSVSTVSDVLVGVPLTDQGYGTPRVDTETRSINMSVVYIVKIKQIETTRVVTYGVNNSEFDSWATAEQLAPADRLILYRAGEGLFRQVEAGSLAALDMGSRTGMRMTYLSGTNFGVGKGARLADDESAVIRSDTAMGKAIDATWSVGPSGGAMDTGGAPNDGTLHVYAIGKADGSVDYLCSDPMVTAPGSPVMPAGWTQRRYLGSLIVRSSAIQPFDQIGRLFQLRDPIASYSAAAFSGALYSIDVPAGVRISAWLSMFTVDSTGAPAGESIQVRSSLANTGWQFRMNSYGGYSQDSAQGFVPTDTAEAYFTRTHSYMFGYVNTLGWMDESMAFTGYE